MYNRFTTKRYTEGYQDAEILSGKLIFVYKAPVVGFGSKR